MYTILNMEKINKNNMSKLDGLGYIYLLDEPLTDYNVSDVLKRRNIIPFFEFKLLDKSLLLKGNYYIHPKISINY